MGVMIAATVIVAILTLIGTVIWWAMMNDWEAKDRKARGRHVNDTAYRDANQAPGSPGSPDDASDDPTDGSADRPIVMKL